ncbi:MAG: coproporphyrinogen III oxidase, partial [Flavobacteriia bacterium]|nr:coproporphyrinogen III oxidase [Flavobacteriia bacterium]
MLLKMIEELENRAQEIQDPIESVYFGGGTPSLLTPDEIGNFLLAIRSQFSLSTDAEITLEVNPED